MSTSETGAPDPRVRRSHLRSTSRQLVRHRDRQIQGVHDRTASRPYRYGSITQRSITARLQLERGAHSAPAWHGKLRGRLRRHPGWEVQNLEPHVPPEAVQRDQVDAVGFVKTAERPADVAGFYRGCATNTTRQPAANHVTHEGGR